MKTEAERIIEMRDFLIRNLERELTKSEIEFIHWFASAGIESYEILMGLFKGFTKR